jgi:hypothetical protein
LAASHFLREAANPMQQNCACSSRDLSELKPNSLVDL